jgi:A/G-specific adenine glycosylase
VSRFASAVISWHARHGRQGLPWQGIRDPYRLWLSEVMLQQTQVGAVIPYYARFLKRFPTLRALAEADEGEVLRLWSGLGYYARGRNLHRAARVVVSQMNGRFPASAGAIAELPGVGRSTAAAIAAFAYGERAAILDGNVKRVLARCFGVEGWPGEKAVEKTLWSLAERLLPASGIETYTQAVMDLGATVCTTKAPACAACPVRRQCVARREERVHALPYPRPRKALPLKVKRWLVLRDGGRVLLERRASRGLWGGLLAFPEFTGSSAERECRRLGFEARHVRRLPALEHGFTHFRLRVHPVLCEIGGAGPRPGSPPPAGHAWMALQDAQAGAVPAPVRVLLQRLQASR